MRKINLASGQRPFGEGWTNIDKQERWNPDFICDMTNMPAVVSNYSEMIVIHHGLEHLDLTSADNCIKECHRILKPGGSLLIFVPDLYELTKAWTSGKIDDYIFCVNLHGAFMGDDADVHRWSYTGKTLAAKLRDAAPWSIIKPFDWRTIEGADLARDWWVLAIEAVK